MTVYLSSFGGVGWQFFDANGDPLSGGKIFTYLAGTTTPATTYTSYSGTVPHTNPIILNAAGRVATGEIWQPAATQYKYVLTSSTNQTVATYDNVGTVAAGAATIERFTGNGSQTTFTLSNPVSTEDATNVYVSGVYQQKDTYSVVGNAIVFSAPPPVVGIEVVYF